MATARGRAVIKARAMAQATARSIERVRACVTDTTKIRPTLRPKRSRSPISNAADLAMRSLVGTAIESVLVVGAALPVVRRFTEAFDAAFGLGYLAERMRFEDQAFDDYRAKRPLPEKMRFS